MALSHCATYFSCQIQLPFVMPQSQIPAIESIDLCFSIQSAVSYQFFRVRQAMEFSIMQATHDCNCTQGESNEDVFNFFHKLQNWPILLAD